MKGLYKNINGQLMSAENAIHYPATDGTIINVKEYIDKPEQTEIHDGWRVFYSREAALEYYGIEEDNNSELIIHNWHDESCAIQIILTYEQNLKLLSDHPEFGLYIKQNNIKTVIENGYVYIYVNYILEEHSNLLLSYLAIIKNK